VSEPRSPDPTPPLPGEGHVRRRIIIEPERGRDHAARNGVNGAARGALPTATTTTQLAPAPAEIRAGTRPTILDARALSVSYGDKRALHGVSLAIPERQITAIIGPSGCGKSTFLRSINRMNDTVPGFAIDGSILYRGQDVYGARVNPVEVRRHIGMVFQRANPFPKSVYDNVAWAPRNLGMKHELHERVERALRQAALWDEVEDRLRESALSLSGGQQQRLCIARAIAIEPDVLLLDEPASALDPIATTLIEELMQKLKHRYTIVIVTHNMQQAARIADRTAFFSLDSRDGASSGVLVEYDNTDTIFTRPSDSRTADYVTGRFG